MELEVPTRSLGEVCENFDRLRVPLSSREREARRGKFPYYGAAGVIDYVDKALFDGLHLLVGEDGSVATQGGRPVLQLPNGKFWVNNHAHVIRCRTDVETRYLYYALSTIHIRPYLSGSVQPKLTQENLNRIEIPYPSEGTRREISSMLGSLDDKIELNRRLNSTLEQIAQALFKSWFVDFDPVRAKAEGRWNKGESLPGMPADMWALWPSEFEDSEIGEIPSGWAFGWLGPSLSEIDTGSRPEGGVKGYTDGVPSIGAENVLGIGRYEFSKTRYVPREFFDGMTRGHLKSGDVLLYKDGAELGRVSYFDDGFPYEQCCVNEHVFVLRPRAPLNSRFLYFWLALDTMREAIWNSNSTSAQPGINRPAVERLPLLTPPAEVLRRFDQTVAPLTRAIFRNALQSTVLGSLRDALLPKLLSGEIRVPVNGVG